MESSKNISVSVVIPAYNAERWIHEALNSVIAQDMADLEIIVVDDGSTDSTASIIREEFGFVNLIQIENSGPSHARNVGTVAASGKYIQYLDADDLLCPGKLNAQKTLLETTGADIAYGDWQYLVPGESGEFVSRKPIRMQMDDEPDIALVSGSFCALHAYLFRHEVIVKGGGWNESMSIVEDIRFIFDLALQGAQFVYCPGLMAQYRKHGSETLSTHSPIMFVRSCLLNASYAEMCWRRSDLLTNSNKRQTALLMAYSYIARAGFRVDPETFEIAFSALKRLSPGDRYIPDQPHHLKLTSQIIGYRRAEAIAALHRQVKSLLRYRRDKQAL